MKRFAILCMMIMLLVMGCGSKETAEAVVEPESVKTESEETVLEQEATTIVEEYESDEEEFNILDYKKAILPDPSIYMLRPYDVKEVDGNLQSVEFYLEPEEETIAMQYIDHLLEGDYYLEEIKIYHDESDTAKTCAAFLRYNGDAEIEMMDMDYHDAHVFVGVRTEKGKETHMLLMAPTDFYLYTEKAHADQTEIPGWDPEEEEKTVYAESDSANESEAGAANTGSEVHIDPSSKLLPDLMYYLNTRGTSPHKSDGGMQYGFQDLPLEYKNILEEELLALLQENRFQLNLINQYRNDITEKTYYDIYEFSYTGTSGMTPLNTDTAGCNVKLAFQCYTKKDKVNIIINYSKEFELIDSGEVTSLVVEARGGTVGDGTIGNWNPQQAEFTKKDCWTCDGDGECTRCNGYSYIWRNDIKSDCTRCSGGRCPSCGGTGKR